jgi:hypothetical protein
MKPRRGPRPIRVFYSVLSQRFYASRMWKEVELQNGKRFVEITGEKFDVTNDIAGLIVQHGITFAKRKES